MEDEGVAIVDCPGFNDNRGGYIEIFNALEISQILKGARKVVLILVVSHVNFTTTANRGKALRDLMHVVKSLLVETSD